RSEDQPHVLTTGLGIGRFMRLLESIPAAPFRDPPDFKKAPPDADTCLDRIGIEHQEGTCGFADWWLRWAGSLPCFWQPARTGSRRTEQFRPGRPGDAPTPRPRGGSSFLP